jgi:hypothetical protein
VRAPPLKSGTERLHSCLRFVKRDIGCDPGDRDLATRSTVGLEADWKPDVHDLRKRGIRRQKHTEIYRQHADDLDVQIVDLDNPADGSGIGVEPPSPKLVADHNGADVAVGASVTTSVECASVGEALRAEHR